MHRSASSSANLGRRSGRGICLIRGESTVGSVAERGRPAVAHWLGRGRAPMSRRVTGARHGHSRRVTEGISQRRRPTTLECALEFSALALLSLLLHCCRIITDVAQSIGEVTRNTLIAQSGDCARHSARGGLKSSQKMGGWTARPFLPR